MPYQLKFFPQEPPQEYCESYSIMLAWILVVQMNYEEKGSEAKTFPDYTNGDVAIWDGEKDNIKLPGSVFSIGK
jgi:hypothetical protein